MFSLKIDFIKINIEKYYKKEEKINATKEKCYFSMLFADDSMLLIKNLPFRAQSKQKSNPEYVEKHKLSYLRIV